MNDMPRAGHKNKGAARRFPGMKITLVRSISDEGDFLSRLAGQPFPWLFFRGFFSVAFFPRLFRGLSAAFPWPFRGFFRGLSGGATDSPLFGDG